MVLSRKTNVEIQASVQRALGCMTPGGIARWTASGDPRWPGIAAGRGFHQSVEAVDGHDDGVFVIAPGDDGAVRIDQDAIDHDAASDEADECAGADDRFDVDDDWSPACADTLLDRDGDGAADPVDNCPVSANGDQADADVDRFGDVCDPNPSDPKDRLSTDYLGGNRVFGGLDYRGRQRRADHAKGRRLQDRVRQRRPCGRGLPLRLQPWR